MSVCQLCAQDLIVELDAESFDEASSNVVGTATVAPDDLLLQCGCHFHFVSWQLFSQSQSTVVGDAVE
jgi:hypothetical protein